MNSAIPSNLRKLLVSGMLFVSISTVFMTANAEAAGKPAGDISRGATSWSQNCARCHEMRGPTEFRDDLWKPIVTHMRVRAGLTGQQQRDILAFLQASNNPLPMKVSASTVAETTAGVTLSGKEIYNQTCVACHGVDGAGRMPGVTDFTAQDGPLSKSDDILLQHVTEGFQSPGSPMAMPAKGGNPSLSEADVRAVLDYLRESFGK